MGSEKLILIDTNIFIYLNTPLVSKDKKRLDLKKRSLEAFSVLEEDVVICHSLTIFKEVSVGILEKKEVQQQFEDLNSNIILENEDIMFNAAEKYRQYLKDFRVLSDNADELIYKSKTIPNDCIIGATAEYFNAAIMTNNGKDFRKYFPNVELIEI